MFSVDGLFHKVIGLGLSASLQYSLMLERSTAATPGAQSRTCTRAQGTGHPPNNLRSLLGNRPTFDRALVVLLCSCAWTEYNTVGR
jgi:hypothetical protein